MCVLRPAFTTFAPVGFNRSLGRAAYIVGVGGREAHLVRGGVPSLRVHLLFQRCVATSRGVAPVLILHPALGAAAIRR